MRNHEMMPWAVELIDKYSSVIFVDAYQGIPIHSQVFFWLPRWASPASQLPGSAIAAQVSQVFLWAPRWASQASQLAGITVAAQVLLWIPK